MSDPFQDVDAAGQEFVALFAESMDVRQNDPTMEKIVAAYLDWCSFPPGGITIEIGSGAGAVTRRIAERAAPEKVIGYEPSIGFIEEARRRAKAHTNIHFEQADGAALPLEDGAVNGVIMHTVLSHVVAPSELVAEAARVLGPGGTLVVCDADFSKATFSNICNDPLDCCAREFVREFVTDPFIVGKLRSLLIEAGLDLVNFDVESRVVTGREQMLPWVEVSTKSMLDKGDIGESLALALVSEHNRRAANGTLYGYQAFATAVARKGGT